MKELLKRTKANMILMAILTILLGLILIIWPASSTMFICRVAGWLLLLGGILSVVIYFSSQEAEMCIRDRINPFPTTISGRCFHFIFFYIFTIDFYIALNISVAIIIKYLMLSLIHI